MRSIWVNAFCWCSLRYFAMRVWWSFPYFGLISRGTRTGSGQIGGQNGHFLITSPSAGAPELALPRLGLRIVIFSFRVYQQEHQNWFCPEWEPKFFALRGYSQEHQNCLCLDRGLTIICMNISTMPQPATQPASNSQPHSPATNQPHSHQYFQKQSIFKFICHFLNLDSCHVLLIAIPKKFPPKNMN